MISPAAAGCKSLLVGLSHEPFHKGPQIVAIEPGHGGWIVIPDSRLNPEAPHALRMAHQT